MIQLPVDQYQLLRLDCSVPSHVGCVISAAMMLVKRRPQDVWISGQPYVINGSVQCDIGLESLWSASSRWRTVRLPLNDAGGNWVPILVETTAHGL